MLRNWQLRAHIDGLISEARRTRRQERRVLGAAELLRIQDRLISGQFRRPQIERIIRKISNGLVKPKDPDQPLTLRERIIKGMRAVGKGRNVPTDLPKPEREWLPGTERRFEDLHHHRVVKLRKEMRAAHLAYGFFLGIAVHDMEETCREPLPLARIRQLAEEFSEPNDFNAETFSSWVDEFNEIQSQKHTHVLPTDVEAAVANIDERLSRAAHPAYRDHLIAQRNKLHEKFSWTGAHEQNGEHCAGE